MREAIVSFINKKLKPGGMVLVSYNALPGWSAMMPLRAIMQTFTAPMQADSISKAREGMRYLKFLNDPQVAELDMNPVIDHPLIGQIMRKIAAPAKPLAHDKLAA